MTEPLFREAPYRTETGARIAGRDERGIWLDRTVFYPRGGGQAGDAGTLVLGDGRALAIADTVKGEGDADILHVPAAGQDLLLAGFVPGTAVNARIDWDRRHRHMRFHTATHLLCAIVPHQTNGCSITAEYARLDFDMVELLDKAVLEAGLAKLVEGAHVANTREIGALRVSKIEKKSARTRRVVLEFATPDR